MGIDPALGVGAPFLPLGLQADCKPTNIADYLILNVRMPRSLTFCYRFFLAEHLKFLGDDYGERHACHATADKTMPALRAGSIRIYSTPACMNSRPTSFATTPSSATRSQDYRFN